MRRPLPPRAGTTAGPWPSSPASPSSASSSLATLSYSLTRSLTTQLTEAVRVANDVALDRLPEVTVTSRDEVGRLLLGMQHMVVKVKERESRAARQRGALRARGARRQRRPVGLGRRRGHRALLAALEGDARPVRGRGAARHRGMAGPRAPRRHRPRARPHHRPPRGQDAPLRVRVPAARPRRHLPLDAEPRRWRCAARTASPRAWPDRRPTSPSASRTSSSCCTTPSTTR